MPKNSCVICILKNCKKEFCANLKFDDIENNFVRYFCRELDGVFNSVHMFIFVAQGFDFYMNITTGSQDRVLRLVLRWI